MGKRIRQSTQALGFVLAATLCGCGSMYKEDVERASQPGRVQSYSGRTLAVRVGSIENRAKIPDEMLADVRRYLADQTADALSRQGVFEVLDDDAFLEQFPDQAGAPRRKADGVVGVVILEIREKMGATVKIGLVSKQKKYAIARVRVRLVVAGGTPVEAVAEGKTSKGAWGAIAMVRRSAMRKGGNVWDIDNSMIGQACTLAVNDAVGQIARRVGRR